MKKIALISDTHSYVGVDVMKYIEQVDEVWHAGDIGDQSVIELLKNTNVTTRIVYGNIDTLEVRAMTEEELIFDCEGVKVYMTHIGGYPGRYVKKVKERLLEVKPDLYICGHSHILKVMRDKKLDLLHFNPGAIGITGFNNYRTMLLFSCDNGKIVDMKAIELSERTRAGKENSLP